MSIRDALTGCGHMTSSHWSDESYVAKDNLDLGISDLDFYQVIAV